MIGLNLQPLQIFSGGFLFFVMGVRLIRHILMGIFFSGCYICAGFGANGVSCDAGFYWGGANCAACGGNEYYCPGFSDVESPATGYGRNAVSAGYYSTGGDATTRTGQSQCTGTTYCTDGVQHECPDPKTHKRTTFPAGYYDVRAFSYTSLVNFPFMRYAITQCQVENWLITSRGELYEYALYNPDTSMYDITNTYGWAKVEPGYYLTTKAACGSNAYYKEVKECSAGSYCPGKDAVQCNASNQATVHTETFGLVPCPAGAYCPANSTAPTLCPAGTANPDAGADTESACAPCTGATYTDSAGSATCRPCPTATNATDVVSYGYWDSAGHVSREGCYANFRGKDVPNGSMTTYHCHVDAGGDSYGVDGSSRLCWTYVDRSELKCDGGYYNEQADGGGTNLPGYPTLEKMWNNACVAVGSGYWSGADAVTRTQCEPGLTTIGHGAGADEAADCGHILHVGTDRVYLRSVKKTSPALAVEYDGRVFYGDMSTEQRGHLRALYKEKVYSIYNADVD